MPVLKVNKNGVWQDIATANSHAHTMSDIADIPPSIVDDVEALKDKVGADSVAYQIAVAMETMEGNAYVHPPTHPADMITGLSNVAISGDYNDLTNKPTIPNIDGFATKTYVDEKVASVGGNGNSGGILEQVQSDWNETDTTSPAYIKNKPSISAEGWEPVQANWNQNDSAQADYIQNKPFGEDIGLVDVLPTAQHEGFTYNSVYGTYTKQDVVNYTLVLGKTYTVFWDGVGYECIAQDASHLMENAIALGNCVNFGLSGNEEPFIIAMINGFAIYMALTDTEDSGSHTIRIAEEGTVVRHLDNKYLSIMEYVEPKQINILPLTQYDNFYLDSSFGLCSYSESPIFDMVLGKTYIVYWDGTECECICQDISNLMSGAVAIGNLSSFGLIGNNEPFIIASIPGLGINYYSLTDTSVGGSHTIKIGTMTDGNYILKEEYNPQPDWNENDQLSATYIKNKPFSEMPSGTVVIKTTTVNCNIDLGQNEYGAIIDNPDIGDYSYEIELDGAIYVPEYYVSDGMEFLSCYNDDGARFSIIKNFNNTGGTLFTINSQGEHTFEVVLAEDVIKTIDPKFIPKINELPDVTVDDNNKVMTVVDGVWIAQTPASGLPKVTTSDAGKFLRVSPAGVWIAETVLNAEEASF